MAYEKVAKGSLGHCDRCIDRVPATTTVEFSFGAGTYRLKVCESDADGFQNDMLRWSRLGTILDDGPPQTLRRPQRDPMPTSRGTVAWSMLEIPDVVATVSAEDETTDDDEIPVVVRPRIGTEEKLPPGHDAWSFSDHAEKRLVERGLSRVEALWCATHPETGTPSTSPKYPNCTVHRRGFVRVVVDPITCRIVTVMHKNQEQKSA